MDNVVVSWQVYTKMKTTSHAVRKNDRIVVVILVALALLCVSVFCRSRNSRNTTSSAAIATQPSTIVVTQEIVICQSAERIIPIETLSGGKDLEFSDPSLGHRSGMGQTLIDASWNPPSIH